MLYLGANVVQTMPSPAETGPTSSWWYKWVFALLHTVGAGLPRVIYTVFPPWVKFLPFNGATQPTPPAQDDKSKN